jgi:hypothetical protein
LGNVTGNITGDVTGDVTNTQLVLESTTNSVLIKSGANGIRLSSLDDTTVQEQYNVQITPGASPTQRSRTLLYGDVEVVNISTSNINGASFKLPSYSNLELASRTLSALNYGELIYNSTANQVQAYISPGSWVSLN